MHGRLVESARAQRIDLRVQNPHIVTYDVVYPADLPARSIHRTTFWAGRGRETLYTASGSGQGVRYLLCVTRHMDSQNHLSFWC